MKGFKNKQEYPATLSVKQLAKHLNIGLNSAYDLVKTDDFPALKIGKRIIVPIAQLEKWVERQTQGGDDRQI